MIDEDGLVVVDVLDFNAHQLGWTLHPMLSPGRVSRDDGQSIRSPDLVVQGAFGGDDAGFRVESEGR